MTSDEYRADTLRMFGISLMVPCGTAILSIPNLVLEKINPFLTICFVLSVILASIGIILIQRGYEILLAKEEKQ